MRDRFGTALALGALAHGVVFASMSLATKPSVGPVITSVAGETVADIEVESVDRDEPEETTSAPDTNTEPSPNPDRAANSPKMGSARTTRHSHALAPDHAATTEASSASPGSGSVGTASEGSPPPSTSTTTIAAMPFLAGDMHSLGPVPAGHDGPSIDDVASQKLDRELGRMLDAQDASRSSVSAGGPVMSASYTAMHGRDAPELGHAIIEVETDAEGKVTTVQLIDGSGPPRDWAPVLRAIQAELAAQRVKVRAGSTGSRVRVDIDVRMRLPSGATSSVTPTFGGSGAGATAGLVGDLSDIGSKAHRDVRIHVTLDERR